MCLSAEFEGIWFEGLSTKELCVALSHNQLELVGKTISDFDIKLLIKEIEYANKNKDDYDWDDCLSKITSVLNDYVQDGYVIKLVWDDEENIEQYGMFNMGYDDEIGSGWQEDWH